MEIAGVGVDIVEVERLQAALHRRGDRLLHRLFTAEELARARPARARLQRLAARFAAKEAVMKALGVGWRGVGWRTIEIRTDPQGRPAVILHGAAQRLAEARGVAEVLVSLTHSGSLAAASAVALRW
ncbi:MAG: holo-ACP synthase [Armatimonadota bacterium]|nr:holo-ACP synthase [Armatimonadota bacterium]